MADVTILALLTKGLAASRTLTALLRCVAVRRSLSGLSRFLAKAPWDADDLAHYWRERFAAQVQPRIAQAHARQRAARPARVGRPTATVVTGYLIGDDSTMHKVYGKKMQALGKHYSTTAGSRLYRCQAAYAFLDEERDRLRDA
jgi:hypothetical protein